MDDEGRDDIDRREFGNAASVQGLATTANIARRCLAPRPLYGASSRRTQRRPQLDGSKR
jgi:hypothetical protein